MADGNKLAEVNALLCVRDEEFRDFQIISVAADDDELLWPLSELKRKLGYAGDESIDTAVNRAKISASKAGFSIKEHFVEGTLADAPDIFLTKYGALLVAINADVEKIAVAQAQAYFALQIDKQRLEDEKRLRTRFEVTAENKRLATAAKGAGVSNFQKFNGAGISALYGNRTVATLKSQKGIPSNGEFLDYVGSEELAANLFRITQTSAALRRQTIRSELLACTTHSNVAKGIRDTIRKAGNTLPEDLPKASTKIDLVATQVKRNLLPKVLPG